MAERKIGEKINQALNLNAAHSYYFHLGTFYHHLKRFPGILADVNGYIRIETEEDYLNHRYLQHTSRLHIRNGISAIPEYVEFTERQKYIINQLSNDNIETNDQAERVPRNIDSIPRNQSHVRLVKRLRDNTCQICNLKLQIGDDTYYSEVHHIRPLGRPHNGPDTLANMICVCPNCHKKLDYGFVEINLQSLTTLARHTIAEIFVSYHNNRIQ